MRYGQNPQKYKEPLVRVRLLRSHRETGGVVPSGMYAWLGAFCMPKNAKCIINKKPQKQFMNTPEIGIFIVLILVTLQVMQNMNRIKDIEWRLTQKMDKPPEPTAWDKWKEERTKKPMLTKEELEKVKRESGEI